MLLIIILVIAIILFFKVRKLYRLNTFDTVVAFTGGLGAGKSCLSSEIAVKLLKRKRREVAWQNLFLPKSKKLPRPVAFSSTTLRISRKEYAYDLKAEHLLLQEKLPLNSVVLIDEIGGFCSQFDYKVENSALFEEFVRFFRHYVQGYLVVNDQCSENIVLQVRRRLNTVYNLMKFRTWFFNRFYTVKVRNISISEEIKTIEEQNAEDNMRTLIGFMPFYRRYDTHCYSDRYKAVPEKPYDVPVSMKKMEIMRISDVHGAKNIDEFLKKNP